jgi:hypothetical protein
MLIKLAGPGDNGRPAPAARSVTAEAPRRVPRQAQRVAVGTVARAPPDTPQRVGDGHEKFHATATCVHDPKHCQPPDGRQRSSSIPGCGSTQPAVRGTPAGRIRVVEKTFCCVTTRRRIFRILWDLWLGFGTLAAHALRFGMLGFSLGIQAALGLPPCCLPAAHLPLTFRILAVSLVPTPRLVLPPAAFAQANPHPRAASTGTNTALWFIVAAAHGSHYLPRDSPGRTCNRSSRALVQIVESRPTCASLPSAE